MLNVLIADKFPEEKQSEFEKLDLHVDYQPQLTPETLPEHIQNTHILCVRSTRITQETIQAATQLMLIVRVGSGTNTIDVQEASKRGIYVANCPGKNAVAVAELTLGLMLSLDRRIPHATAALRQNQWNKKEFSKADGIKGKTFGIVGLGRIGVAVAQRAKAFDMKVVAWDRWLTPDKAKELGVTRYEHLEELCKNSDVISVHLPLTNETKGMFNRELFAHMKAGTLFINTSRGDIHDRDALIEAMDTRNIRAGLDVFVGEPGSSQASFESPILGHPNFVGTPHIGASTQQAQLSVASEAIRVVRTFLEQGEVPNCVNLQKQSDTPCQLIVRHYDKVGVLASVLNVLQEANINIKDMKNIIFQGSHAAVATISLSQHPSAELLQRIESMKDKVIQVMLVDNDQVT